MPHEDGRRSRINVSRGVSDGSIVRSGGKKNLNFLLRRVGCFENTYDFADSPRDSCPLGDHPAEYGAVNCIIAAASLPQPHVPRRNGGEGAPRSRQIPGIVRGDKKGIFLGGG